MIQYLARLAPPPRKKPLSRLLHSTSGVGLPAGPDGDGGAALAGVEFYFDSRGAYIAYINGPPGCTSYDGASRSLTPDELHEIADTAERKIRTRAV